MQHVPGYAHVVESKALFEAVLGPAELPKIKEAHAHVVESNMVLSAQPADTED